MLFFINTAPWRLCSCGNGLLVHILLSEGYQGFGVDVRARTSWSHYPPATQRHLHVKALDPTFALTGAGPVTIGSDPAITQTPLSGLPDTDPPGGLEGPGHKEEGDQVSFHLQIPHGVFVIGNHADELTPYVPILSILYVASGYLNVPCCPWDLDQKFTRADSTQYPLPVHDFEGADGRDEVSTGTEAGDIVDDNEQWIESLNLGGNGNFTSSYSTYRIWLARLTSWCGWEIETEVLRIPSTRNWALVGKASKFWNLASLDEAWDLTPYSDVAGRKRRLPEEVSRKRVEDILTRVRERGVFAVRQPEGKRGDH